MAKSGSGNSGNEDIPTSYPLNDRHLTELRIELETKIEKNVPLWVLTVVTPIVALIVASIFGYAFFVINKSNDKIDNLNSRITVIETILKSHHML